MPFKTEQGVVAEPQAFLEVFPLAHNLLFERKALAVICPSDVLGSPLDSPRDFRTLHILYVQICFIVFGSAQSVHVILAATATEEEDH